MLKRSIELIQGYGFYLLALILLITVAITNAEPIKDGDFFWQMEYGRYMLENKTLIPDHTIYSWTPSTDRFIYCAWIAEIALYLMHKTGGLPLLFAFRYICVLALLFIVWVFAYKMGKARDIFTFFVLLIVLLANYGATFLKPELMSMVYMAVVGGLYFSVKASLWGKWGTRPFLFYPIIFLLWVNTHGVFIFGLTLLAAITSGEVLNYWVGKEGRSFSKQGMRYLLTGAFLSVAATLINPYGIDYYINLYYSYLAPTDDLRMATVGAFVSPFDERASRMHLDEFWGIMAVTLTVIFLFSLWKKRSWDWAILVPNLFLAWIASRHIRSVFYWPAFWGMSVIYITQMLTHHDLPPPEGKKLWGRIAGWSAGLLRSTLPKATPAFKGLVLIAFFLLAYRASYEVIYDPPTSRWCGFGIGYLNPVQASAFLKEHRPGKQLYNSYDIGGYLIHDLYPLYKVSCDPRAFPYADWYDEYWDFNAGSAPLEEFSKKYPFDVAIVDLRASESPIVKFLMSRDWEPVFYGPVAIVFVRSDVGFVHDFRKSDKHRFDEIKSLYYAGMAFNIAASLGDIETSGYLLELIKGRFTPRNKGYRVLVENISSVQNGLAAYERQDYETAWENLSKLDPTNAIIRVSLVIFHLRNWKAKQLIIKGNLREALNLLEAALVQRPDYADGYFNAGILGYQVRLIEQAERESGDPEAMWKSPTTKMYTGKGFISKFEGKKEIDWRNHLEVFLGLAPDHRYAHVARQVLEGKGLPETVPLIL
ncbi:MAG: hypothetical protein SV775_14715 [Thermodesulfobacteriota bacterium]|nr:hypothetical protein [Thermodesulfobacteriota bacterium]